MDLKVLALFALAAMSFAARGGQTMHTFALSRDDFLLDGKPFQIRAGEIHPFRVPAEYWRHRIRMAKAMGLNAISAYVFWNYLEPEEGKFDFRTGNHNLSKFIKTCQEEGMWVILRPGPYCCAEWDLGGIPSYLLKIPDIKLRCSDPRYLKAAERYLTRLATVVKPLQVTQGGPILMLQIENEYGSYGNDRSYIGWLHEEWRGLGIDVPFYTADGPTTYMLEAGSWPGAAVGLDSLGSLDDVKLARRMNPGVPVWSSETYPGWLTHWGEKWATASTESISNELKFLLDNRLSFSLYVVHGGTNFEYWAGANSGGKGYEPDVTSYDYDAPITEQGRATPKYLALRELIGKRLLPGEKLAEIPDPIATVEIPKIEMKARTTVWDHLPAPIALAQPVPFESLGQRSGFVLYRTKLIGHKSGQLHVTDLHDFATVFLDGQLVGTLDRRDGRSSLTLPATKNAIPVLDILVEGMGRINFAQQLIDRKGITERVTLNGMTLMDWQIYPLPMDEKWVQGLSQTANPTRPGTFFEGRFHLDAPADTYIDLSAYKKGIVWVNGHNLGRFWEIGPQFRLYCPAPWLKQGENDIIVFDLLQTEARPLSGKASL